MVGWQVENRVLQYVNYVGFMGFHRMAYVPVDRALITALVERWRQETHSFHLPVGEATITLRDVAILTRLPIHGTAVTGHALVDPRGLVHRVLGVMPPPDAIRGTGLRHTWLRETFGVLPVDAPEHIVANHARAYLFMLIGGALFGNKTGSHIQLVYLQLLDNSWERIRDYSWGSACLATLYRNLCRASARGALEIGGPLIVLQVLLPTDLLICILLLTYKGITFMLLFFVAYNLDFVIIDLGLGAHSCWQTSYASSTWRG